MKRWHMERQTKIDLMEDLNDLLNLVRDQPYSQMTDPLRMANLELQNRLVDLILWTHRALTYSSYTSDEERQENQ